MKVKPYGPRWTFGKIGLYQPTGPVTEWLPNGRDMLLLHEVSYVDSRGELWVAEKDSIINGQSIPGIAWTLTGQTPYTGPGRDGSIPHDAAWARAEKMKDRRAADAYRRRSNIMFREIILERGVSDGILDELEFVGVEIGRRFRR